MVPPRWDTPPLIRVVRAAVVILLLASACLLNAQQSQVTFATFFGGKDLDYGNAVAVGAGGDIWIGGATRSEDLPVVNASQPKCAGGSSGNCQDAFLARISADGREMRFATYFGSTANDHISALAVDSKGYAYAAGAYRGGALVARFDPAGKPVFALSLGGPEETMSTAITLDAAGNAYVTGYTFSRSIPLVNPLQSEATPASCTVAGRAMPVDVFVTKVSPGGEILFSTYLGGNGNDYGQAIGVDALGRIYVAGATTSTDLPVPGAIQSTNRGGADTTGTCGGGDAFLLQLDPEIPTILFGTYLGGPGVDQATSLFVETGGTVILTGSTPGGFPVTSSGAGFVRSFGARVDTQSRRLLQSFMVPGILGRASVSRAGRITAGINNLLIGNTADWRIDDAGGIGAFVQQAVAGPDDSIAAVGSANAVTDFFRPVNALQPRVAGMDDAWLIRTTPAGRPQAAVVNSASFTGPVLAPGSIASVFSTQPFDAVRVGGEPAVVLNATPAQANIVLPAAAPGYASISLLSGSNVVTTVPVFLQPVAPAVFTANSDGEGVPAAQVLRVSSATGARELVSPFQCSQRCEPAQVDASNAEWTSVLTLYGTGIRARSTLANVFVAARGLRLPVLYAGAQNEFPGLDQVNVVLPSELSGAGLIDVTLVVDGRLANPVTLRIR